MKKFLTFLPIALLANPFDDLVNAYNQEDYKTSYDIASSICRQTCSDINLNLIMGKSAFRLGLYDEALAAYDRVLVLDDTNTEARLQSAIIYQKNGNLALLKLELENLKDDERLNDDEKALVASMLKNVKYQQKANNEINIPYASIGFGYGYDSNPKKQNLKDSYLPVPQLGINFPIPGAKHQPASSILANLNAGYKKQVNNVYDYDININFYNKYYIKPIEEDFQNLSVFTASINNGFEISRQFKLNILMSYDYIILKQKRYLNTFTADISGDYYTESGLAFGLGYTINHNNYLIEDNKENDSNHHSIYAMSKIISQRSMSYLKIAYDIEKTSRIKESSNNYKEYSATAGIIYMLNKQVILKASLGYAKGRYDEKIFLNTRNDITYRVNFGAEYNMDHHNFFSLDLGYNRVKSSIEYTSYDNIYTNLMYKYKF